MRGDGLIGKLAAYDACTGCTACLSVCCRDAISMRPDFFGFSYPHIDASKCVNCHACERVCPVLRPFPPDEIGKCYAARTKDRELLKVSTSGGVFSELAIPVIKSGGCVFGCVFDAQNLCAYHTKAESTDQLAAMRGSKYVQSDMRNVLKEVKAELQRGRRVLFSGTPCQVAAVNRVVGENENLLTIDLFCHGVPSPQFLSSYLTRIERSRGSKITHVRFRQKDPSWRAGVCLSYEFVDSDKAGSDVNDGNLYCKIYTGDDGFGAHANRLSCYQCVHRRGASNADITIADFWGIEDCLNEMDDDTGVSAVVVHSRKGADAFFASKHIEYRPVTFKNVIRKNDAYCVSAPKAFYRGLFLLVLKLFHPRIAVLLVECLQIIRQIIPTGVRAGILKLTGGRK